MDECRGFEYFVKSSAKEVSPTWEEGDCTPQTNDDTKGCDNEFYQLNFWRKDTRHCKEWARKDLGDSKASTTPHGLH